MNEATREPAHLSACDATHEAAHEATRTEPVRAGMTPRQKRFTIIGLGVAALALAAGLVLYALSDNLVYFYTPSDVVAGKAPKDRPFRIGGLVEMDSVKREGTRVQFVVTDNAQKMQVAYVGSLPDLFKEGKGVVAQGQIGPDGRFTANEVLAKHDENYMPPEAQEAIRRAGHPASIDTLKKD